MTPGETLAKTRFFYAGIKVTAPVYKYCSQKLTVNNYF